MQSFFVCQPGTRTERRTDFCLFTSLNMLQYQMVEKRLGSTVRAMLLRKQITWRWNNWSFFNKKVLNNRKMNKGWGACCAVPCEILETWNVLSRSRKLVKLWKCQCSWGSETMLSGKSREPRAKKQEPRSKSKEPRATSQEQRTRAKS